MKMYKLIRITVIKKAGKIKVVLLFCVSGLKTDIEEWEYIELWINYFANYWISHKIMLYDIILNMEEMINSGIQKTYEWIILLPTSYLDKPNKIFS